MKFLIELTDLFCGEPNFSWVDRYYVEAEALDDAIAKFQTYFEQEWVLYFRNSEYAQYISDSNVCVFIVADDGEDLSEYKRLE